MKRRILIVDDEVTFAAILTEYFEERGYTVRTAHDGLSALEEAKRFTPAVILTDIQMPIRSGYEWVRELRDRGSNPLLIFMSAYDRYRDPDLMEQCKADLYLQKPFKLHELETFIEKTLVARSSAGGADDARNPRRTVKA